MTPLGHLSIAFLSATVLAALFPNVDHKTIFISTSLGATVLDFDLVYHVIKKGKSGLGKDIGQHRFLPTHTPFFALFLSLPILFYNQLDWLFFLIGIITHFFFDMFFFPEGINLIYPFGKKSFSFLVIKKPNWLAPKKIYQDNNWWKHYLASPLFWFYEGIPTFLCFVILLAK